MQTDKSRRDVTDMHNRCRMIVASFLSKDLLIDWREGEKYFSQNLVDADVSAFSFMQHQQLD